MDPGPFHQPVPYYRCTVQSQIPIELHDVTTQQRSMLIAGHGTAS